MAKKTKKGSGGTLDPRTRCAPPAKSNMGSMMNGKKGKK